MTTYHLERRVPRPYETYVLEAITTGFPAPGMVTTAVDVLPTTTRYVITEDRPRGEHPEALLIRVNGELYGRTYVPESNEAAYNSVNDIANFQYASDITEWEDVYDEVPAEEPEPERREYTDAELDDLPEGTCAWDEHGGVWQLSATHWFLAGASGGFTNPLRERVRQHLYSAPPEEN